MNDSFQAQPSLVLASGSPRRAELLARMGLGFLVDSADIAEEAEGTPEQIVCALAERKARAVALRHPQAWILGADTLVYCGEALGKPEYACDAARMLRMLSGRWHSVHSGICLLDARSGVAQVRHVVTRVLFAQLDEASIDRYVATGEPMDKAGAYGIQGIAGMFVERIEGCYTNVVGLSTATLREMLRSVGWTV